MNCKMVIVFILLVLYGCNVVPHGFAGHTVVGLKQNQEFSHIKDISSRFLRGQTTDVCTYKEKSQTWKVKSVQAVAHCQSDLFFELSFAKKHTGLSETIRCSPLQLFYRALDKAWIPAYELCEGDILLCKNHVTTRLRSKKSVSNPIELYIIEVKKHHTFVVGRQKILTHNLFIPVATTIGMAIPFDMILGAGSFGCMFGPVTFCCSIAVAGVAAAIGYQCSKEKHTNFTLKCDRVGYYEMQPMHHGKGCGRIVPDLGYTYKATVEDVLQGVREQGNTGGPSKIYEKPGNYEDALKDFENLRPDKVNDFTGKDGNMGKTGTLLDGRKITARIGSKDSRPTLQIWPTKGSRDKIIKIRYGDKKIQ